MAEVHGNRNHRMISNLLNYNVKNRSKLEVGTEWEQMIEKKNKLYAN